MFHEGLTQPGTLRLFDFGGADEFGIVIGCGERFSKRVHQTARHARSEVDSGATEQNYDAGSHVLTSVLPHAFDNCESAAVAHGETFAGASGDIEFTASRSVENGVTGQGVAALRSVRPRGDGNCAAAQTLADVIVRFSGEPEADAGNQERSEALSGGAAKFAMYFLMAEACVFRAAKDLTAQMRADTTVGVGDGEA